MSSKKETASGLSQIGESSLLTATTGK